MIKTWDRKLMIFIEFKKEASLDALLRMAKKVKE
jgi:hypothetical protein